MKTSVIQLFIIISFWGCVKITKPSESVNNSTKNEIEGSWKLVYADIKENDSLQIKDLNNTDFIKIINADHFAFFNQKRESSDEFLAGGGTYTFNGSDYIETLTFINAPSYRGHVFSFQVEIKGDSLIQQGHEKIEAAGVDRFILEKYIRINTKN